MSCARELSIIFNQLPLLRSYWWKMAVLHYMLRLWSLANLQGYTQLSLSRVIHNSLCPGLYTTLFAQGYTQLSLSRVIHNSLCPGLYTTLFVQEYLRFCLSKVMYSILCLWLYTTLVPWLYTTIISWVVWLLIPWLYTTLFVEGLYSTLLNPEFCMTRVNGTS